MNHQGKCYCGGAIRLPDCLDDLDIGQQIIVNKNGRVGKIKEKRVCSHVLYYYIVFPEDPLEKFFGHRYKPYEITPVEE